jgi:hypothetical protein
MLRCWHLVWILVKTDHPCLGVGCHIRGVRLAYVVEVVTMGGGYFGGAAARTEALALVPTSEGSPWCTGALRVLLFLC